MANLIGKWRHRVFQLAPWPWFLVFVFLVVFFGDTTKNRKRRCAGGGPVIWNGEGQVQAVRYAAYRDARRGLD
jgi:hypothetical protein